MQRLLLQKRMPMLRPWGQATAAMAAGARGARSDGGSGHLGLGWALPPPAGLSAPAWHALVVLLAALPALMLDALMEGVLAP